MGNAEKIFFMVQARNGSSRLPGKILLPFYEGKSILELLIDKLLTVEETEVVVATSTAEGNEAIEALARHKGVACFRGAENDVLERFIQAAETFKATKIIRVCSDNPFLERESICRLRDYALTHPCDYASFDIFGRPSIQTHYGFWTEFVTLETLKRIKSLTDEPLYHEHVTNYIYSHPDAFDIHWLKGPEALKGHEDIRLTIDTEEDFRVARQVYHELQQQSPYPSIPEVIHYLDQHPDYYSSMKNQIIKNSK